MAGPIDSNASFGAGGCDFPSDPDAPPEQESPVWSPGLQPQAVMLSPAEHQGGEAEPTIVLAHLDGLRLRRAEDGWHGIWQANGVAHQFWLREAVPDAAAFYAATLPLDSWLELRTHAARRLWRAMTGRPPGVDFRALPAQLRQWHILSLRALDARLRGDRAVTPEMIDALSQAARSSLRIEGGGYRQDHLRAFAQRFEVADDEVRIMGKKSDLFQSLVAASSGKTAALPVRSSVLNWRARKDSNF